MVLYNKCVKLHEVLPTSQMYQKKVLTTNVKCSIIRDISIFMFF